MTQPNISAPRNFSTAAADLLKSFQKIDIMDAWKTLAVLPPEASLLTASYFEPCACLDFVNDAADGKNVADFYDFSFHGINCKTHLNILGRIQAGQNFLKNNPDICMVPLVSAAVTKLDDFESQFSEFLYLYQGQIVSGLKEREGLPKAEQMDPKELWREKNAYKVGAEIMPYARFAQVDRDLRCDQSINDVKEQRALRSALNLPLELNFPLRPSPSPALPPFARGLISALVGR